MTDAWVNKFTRPASASAEPAEAEEAEARRPAGGRRKPSVAAEGAQGGAGAKKPAGRRQASSTAARPTAVTASGGRAAAKAEPGRLEEAAADSEALREAQLAQLRMRRGPSKRAVTYRFEEDVLELVDLAVLAAFEKGEKLSKEEAVARAIRRAYGRLS